MYDLIELAVKSAREAGAAIMDYYESVVTFNSKYDGSPVTKADIIAHNIIKELLSTSEFPVVSEEVNVK